MTRQTTLSVEAGTAEYALPDDYIMLIRLQYPQADQVMPSPWWPSPWTAYNPYGCRVDAYPVAEYTTFNRNDYIIYGNTITFSRTPRRSETYTLRYGAAHVLSDDGDTYATLTDELVAVVLLRAQSAILRAQAQQSAQGAGVKRYQQGDVTIEIDHATAAKSLQAQAASLEQQYEQRIMAIQGATGLRAYP